MDLEGFKRHLNAEGLEAKSIGNYLRLAQILDRDLKRLTGKGLHEAGLDEVKTCFADYNQRLKPSTYNTYIAGARKYLGVLGIEGFEETLKNKRSSKRRLPSFLREEEVKQLIQAADNLRDKLI